MKTQIAIAVVALYLGSLSEGRAQTAARERDTWMQKEEVTIGVMDSGLGGISVVADLENRLRHTPHFRQVSIVFFNACFSKNGGYNSLPSIQEKVRFLDDALYSLSRRFHPDQVLLACNTLSVLVDQTSFSAKENRPLCSIVPGGVELIAQALHSSPHSQVILFGTRTTVSQDTHRKRLFESGGDSSRVIPQVCPELADSIERGYDSLDTELLIEAFVDEAIGKLKPPVGPVFVSLNCSHYPFAEPLWKEAFRDHDLHLAAVLNPNRAMLDTLLDGKIGERYEQTLMHVMVVSKVEIPESKRRSIARAVEHVSSITAAALRDYQWLPNLF